MQYHVALRVCITFLILAISHAALGQVVYSDGVTHTIPGDPAFTNGQSIALQAASGLIINDNALVEGGEVSSNQFAQGEHAISAQAGTSIHQTDGSATGGTGTVNGNLFSTSSISAIGGAGISTRGSYVGIGGEIFGGFAYAISANPNGDLSISNNVNATGGPALSLLGGATANLSGVSLMGGNSEAWNAEILNYAVGGAAISLNDSGPVTISSGEYFGGQGTATNEVINFADATGEGGPALDVRGISILTINDGAFSGGAGIGSVTFFPESIPTGIGASALIITGPVTVTINGGVFESGSNGGGGPLGPVLGVESALLVVGDADVGNLQLTINGGTFDGIPYFGAEARHGLETVGDSPNATNARIDIYGGDFLGNSKDIHLANPDITATIYGTDFLLDGDPIELGLVIEESGTLEGVLANGSPFEWSFERVNGAPLMLATPCDLENTDVSSFVTAVLTASTDPLLVCTYDTNSDGVLNGLDIQGFVERILGI